MDGPFRFTVAQADDLWRSCGDPCAYLLALLCWSDALLYWQVKAENDLTKALFRLSGCCCWALFVSQYVVCGTSNREAIHANQDGWEQKD